MWQTRRGQLATACTMTTPMLDQYTASEKAVARMLNQHGFSIYLATTSLLLLIDSPRFNYFVITLNLDLIHYSGNTAGTEVRHLVSTPRQSGVSSADANVNIVVKNRSG